jgi:hypothetical protein
LAEATLLSLCWVKFASSKVLVFDALLEVKTSCQFPASDGVVDDGGGGGGGFVVVVDCFWVPHPTHRPRARTAIMRFIHSTVARRPNCG